LRLAKVTSVDNVSNSRVVLSAGLMPRWAKPIEANE
jgi:hypothetical protein